ncbi:MAG: HEAT repeat domain-containing protein [Bacteroidia bacterium]
MISWQVIEFTIEVLAPVTTFCTFLVAWKSRGQAWPIRRRKRLWILPGRVPKALKFLLSPLIVVARYARVSPALPVALGLAGALALMGLSDAAFNSLIGYFLLFPLAMIRDLKWFRTQLEAGAARSLAQQMDSKHSEPILLNAASDPEALTRLAAIPGLETLGTDAALQALEALSHDRNEKVASQAHLALSQAKLILQGHQLEETPGIMDLVERHLLLLDQLQRDDTNPDEVEPIVLEVESMLDRAARQCLPARRAYPDLLCQACLTRARQMSYKTWVFVHCRHCIRHDLLQAGVKRVVGEIGGVMDWDLKEGLLKIGLWDEERRTARAADIEALHVIGGSNLNYDWAVSAVVEAMQQFQSEMPEALPIELIDNPSISANSVALLRTLSPRLQMP